MRKSANIILTSILVVSGISMLSAVLGDRYLTDRSGKAGQIRGDEDHTKAIVSSRPYFDGDTGAVKFQYRGRHFLDEGFDTAIDKIWFERADENGVYRRVDLTPDMPEFQEHLPLYLEAREIATHGKPTEQTD